MFAKEKNVYFTFVIKLLILDDFVRWRRRTNHRNGNNELNIETIKCSFGYHMINSQWGSRKGQLTGCMSIGQIERMIKTVLKLL